MGTGAITNTTAIGFGSTATTACYIQGIYGVTLGTGSAVFVSPTTGQLGTVASTRRVKKNIQDMVDCTRDLYKLRPVTFNYINDEEERLEYGLIAEEVEEVYPNIVIKGKDGLPETVQYQYLPMMMLNEMQNDRARIVTLENKIAELEQKINQLLQDHNQ